MWLNAIKLHRNQRKYVKCVSNVLRPNTLIAKSNNNFVSVEWRKEHRNNAYTIKIVLFKFIGRAAYERTTNCSMRLSFFFFLLIALFSIRFYRKKIRIFISVSLVFECLSRMFEFYFSTNGEIAIVWHFKN